MRHFSEVFKRSRAIGAIETIVYIAVFSMILTAISMTMLSVYRSQDFALSSASAMVDMRRALELALSNIKEASFSDAGAYPVKSMADNEFVFYSDIDNDGKIEQVRFFVDDGIFKRGTIKSSGIPPTYDNTNEELRPIAWHVKNADHAIPIFQYFDKDEQQITDFSKILDLRFVSIRLLIDTDPNRPPEYYDFRSNATLRNIVNSYDKW